MPPGVLIYDTLAAGEVNTGIDMDVSTTSTEGTMVVNLRVASMGDPGIRDSINLYTQVGSGIEEKYDIIIAKSQFPMLHIYPNPFYKTTKIMFEFGQENNIVDLKIYDATGQLTKQFDHATIRLSDNVVWDGTDDHGFNVTPGVYFIKLQLKNHSVIQKVTLIK